LRYFKERDKKLLTWEIGGFSPESNPQSKKQIVIHLISPLGTLIAQ
jgi:hypothetical protein